MGKSIWYVPILGQSNAVGLKNTIDDGISGQMVLETALNASKLYDEAQVTNFALGGSTVDGDHFYNAETSPNAIWWFPDSNTPGPLLINAIERIRADLAGFYPDDSVHLSIVWSQGEANAESIRKGISDADRYKEGTLEAFRYIEQQLNLDIDFFLAQTGRYVQREDQTYASYLTRVAAQEEILRAQEELAAENSDIHIGAITKDLDMRDEVHLTYESYEIVGARLANSMIAFENHAPIITEPTDTITVHEDAAFSYTIPDSLFSDTDEADSIAISATSTTGGDLPSWLSFDSETLTFTGTPDNNSVGKLFVSLVATDSHGATSTQSIAIIVNNTNDTPILIEELPDAQAAINTPFVYHLSEWFFVDVDKSDTLSFSATLGDGSALPEWLSFDATTNHFVGTPPEQCLGDLSICITATDASGESISDNFTLSIVKTIDDGTDDSIIRNQIAHEDQTFAYDVPQDVFLEADINNDLTYTATLEDGTAIPSWLTFDAATCRFSGTPNHTDVSNFRIILTGTDSLGDSISQAFSINVKESNDAPVLNGALVYNFTSLIEDADIATNTGRSVANILRTSVYDEDVNALTGIAITGLDNSLGNWQFRIDNGVWQTIEEVSANHALTLDATAFMRFVPNPNAHGTQHITFHAWDQTTGTTGYYTAITETGGSSAYSNETASSKIIITSVADTITGTLYHDILISDDDSDSIWGLYGNDTIQGNDGNDTAYGSTGNDSIFGDNGNDSLYGEDGNDSLYGGDGNDSLSGSKADDVLVGGNGNDTLSGGTENDVLYGDAGYDSLSGNAGNDTVYGGDHNDTINGSTGNDVLYGDNGNDSVSGSTDSDTLFGGDGNDRLSGGTEDDLLFGEEGNDLLYGDAGNDTIYGGNGNDSISSSTGNDKLFGGDGNDTLSGSTDSDLLYGGEGNDKLSGGTEDDWLWGDAGMDSLYGDAGNDSVYGGGNNDSVSGSYGQDALFGEEGNDTLVGGDENDILQGGMGNDSLKGGNHDDILFGNEGADILYGEAGADRFCWSFITDSGVGTLLRDSVRDYNHAAGDTLDFSGLDGTLSFINTGSFTGSGHELRYSTGTSTLISIDMDGDKIKDMEVYLIGNHILTESDFAL